MDTFYLKYRDTRPILEVELKDPDGTAHDLTGATAANLHIKLEDGSAVLSRDMVFDSDRTTGIVRYTWETADWTDALLLGTHRMEYEILGPSTARLSFPNSDDDKLIIISDLGQGS